MWYVVDCNFSRCLREYFKLLYYYSEASSTTAEASEAHDNLRLVGSLFDFVGAGVSDTGCTVGAEDVLLLLDTVVLLVSTGEELMDESLAHANCTGQDSKTTMF